MNSQSLAGFIYKSVARGMSLRADALCGRNVVADLTVRVVGLLCEPCPSVSRLALEHGVNTELVQIGVLRSPIVP